MSGAAMLTLHLQSVSNKIHQFTHALELMNQALSRQTLMSNLVGQQARMEPAMGRQQAVAVDAHQKHMEILASRTSGSDALANFKDLVEKKAEEHGLLFMPVPNKFREGKPVYQFGSCQIYVDRNVVFLLQPSSNQWIPVSLEQLVTSAS